MRLLHVKRLIFEDFSNRKPEPYVTASHRWLDGEITYQDVRDRKRRTAPGYKKVLRFAKYIETKIPSIKWLWIDTCCIDKTNSVELSTAINSMFRWYRDAALCLAHLHDVPSPYEEATFRRSDWFKRGWTLQELLAPSNVVFLSSTWQILGYKQGRDTALAALLRLRSPLNGVLSNLTGIPEAVLKDFSLSHSFGVEERFAWSKDRSTTVPEDSSYCMVGIFGVNMSIRYGCNDDGKQAKDRLRAKIIKKVREEAHTARMYEHDDKRLTNNLEDLQLIGLRALQYHRRQLVNCQVVGPPSELKQASDIQLFTMALWNQQLQSSQGSLTHALETQVVNDRLVAVPSSAVSSQSQTGQSSHNMSIVRVTNHTATSSMAYPSQTHLRKRKGDRQILRIKLGWALLSKWSYEVIVMRTMSGWNVALSYQATVPHDSPIMELCMSGGTRRMQYLVSSGKASWYDRNEYGWTLLEVAVISASLDTCKYLLANVQWPEHELVMHQALSRMRHIGPNDAFPDEFIEVFFGQHRLRLDVDLLRAWQATALLHLLSSSARWNHIASHMVKPWYSLPLADRFDLLSGRLFISSTLKTPMDIQRTLGIDGSAGEWLTLRSLDGASTLHMVANMLFQLFRHAEWTLRPAPSHSAWTEWGSMLLRAGLDPHSMEGEHTACVMFLQVLHTLQNDSILYHGLNTWLRMVQDAGIDMGLYVERENELWKSNQWIIGRISLLEVTMPDKCLQKWSLEIKRAEEITLYERHMLPAAFTSVQEYVVPMTICWEPDKKEKEEGVWTRGRTIKLWSDAFQIGERFDHGAILAQLLNTAQDDAGMVKMLIDASAKQKPGRLRHTSAPPPIYRRHQEYRKRLWPHLNPWMRDLHLCPTSSRFKLGGCSDDTLGSGLRYCLEARVRDCISVQKQIQWSIQSLAAQKSAQH